MRRLICTRLRRCLVAICHRRGETGPSRHFLDTLGENLQLCMCRNPLISGVGSVNSLLRMMLLLLLWLLSMGVVVEW